MSFGSRLHFYKLSPLSFPRARLLYRMLSLNLPTNTLTTITPRRTIKETTCSIRIKVKEMFRLRTVHEGSEGEYRYNSTLSLTSALDGGGSLTPRPGKFTSGKETRYPLCRRLGGPQGRLHRDSIPGPSSP